MFRLPTLRKKRKEVTEYKLPEKFGTDLRGFGPLFVCTCGNDTFSILARFADYKISWYFLDGECINCGNLIRVPCEVDDPNSPYFQA